MRVLSCVTSEGANDWDMFYRKAQDLLLATRHFVNVGGVDGTVSVDDVGYARIVANGGVIWETEVRPEDVGEGPGRVEIMYSTHQPLAQQVALIRNGELLTVDAHGLDKKDTGRVAESLKRFWEVVRLRRCLVDGGARLAQLLAELPELRGRHQELRSKLTDIARRLYRDFALPGHNMDSPTQEWHSCAPRLRPRTVRRRRAAWVCKFNRPLNIRNCGRFFSSRALLRHDDRLA